MTTITLKKTLTTAGNRFGFDGDNTVTLKCRVGSPIWNVVKKLKKIPSVTGFSNQDDVEPVMSILDLKRITESITIEGSITGDEISGVNNEVTVKNTLIAMAEQGGRLDLNIDDEPTLESYGNIEGEIFVNIDSMEFRDQRDDSGADDAKGEVGFDFRILLTIGGDRGDIDKK